MKHRRFHSSASFQTILTIMLLGFANPTRAIMTVFASYDSDSNMTTLDFSGSWDTFTNQGGGYQTGGDNTGASYLISFDGSFDSYNTGLTLDTGSGFPTVSKWTRSGDFWGFNSSYIAAPQGYTAGTSITGSFIKAGDLFDITNTPIQGGSYSGGGNTLNWTTEAIPEPSTFALILGISGCLFAWTRRIRS